ncbi:MAG TPA: TMEM175 family protein [Methylibium sp.]
MGRLEAFSDGVIAIIITIMVLELKLPEHQVVNSVWADVILPMWPKLLAYLWSFVLVGLMWINHHHLLHSLSSASRPLAWLNLHLLFWMSLVPATTALIGDHPKLPGAVATYALVHGANTCGFLILRRYAQRLSRTGQARGHSVHTAMFLRNIAGVLMYLGAAACAFLWLPLAYALIAAVPLLFLSSPAMKEEAAS